MIPMMMKIKIPRQHDYMLTLYLPLFIAWLMLIPFLILCLPFVLLAAVLTWNSGTGRFLLVLYPLIFSLLWNLRGLKIDVHGRKDKIYLSLI